MKFFIVNDCDRPQASLVAYMRKDGRLNYLDRSKKSYDGMGAERATPIDDFGFETRIVANIIQFVKFCGSGAKYYDGSPRDWQGEHMFLHMKPDDAMEG